MVKFMMKSRKRFVVIILLLLVFCGICFADTSTIEPVAAATTSTNPLKLLIPSGMYNFGFYSDANSSSSLDELTLSADVSSNMTEWGSASYKYYAYGTFYVNWSVFTKTAIRLVLSVPKITSGSGQVLPYVDIADSGMTAIGYSDSLLVQSFNTGAIDKGSKQFSVRVDMADAKSTDSYSAVVVLKVISVS